MKVFLWKGMLYLISNITDRIRKNRREVGMAFLFAFISFIMVIPFVHSGTLQITNDGVFHLQRINEIFDNLKNGKLSYIATHTFSHVGIASFEFYPSVFLYPWAALQFIFRPVTAFYIGWGIILFVTFEIAFHCMWSFSDGDWLRSAFFAIIYGVSGKFITEFARFQLGELFAYMFLPLAFLGFCKIFVVGSRNSILTLSIGMALIAYSHFITLYITIGLMLCLFIALTLKREITWNKIKYGIQSVVLFLLLSLWEFTPLVTNSFSKKIAPPGFSFWPVDVNVLWNTSWGNQLYSDSSIGIMMIIILVIGWLFVVSNKEKWIYFLGVFLCFMTTTLFPWGLIAKTKLIHLFMPLQYSFRLIPLAVLMLSITGSLVCVKVARQFNKGIKPFIILVMLVIVAGSYAELISPLVRTINNGNIQLLTAKMRTLPITIAVRNKQYNYINNDVAPTGSIDYMPKSTVKSQKLIDSVQSGDVFVNGNRIKYKVMVGPNTITYRLYAREGESINLPAIKYKRTFVKLNNKAIVTHESNRGTVQVNTFHTGRQLIEVTYKPTLLYYLLMIMALLIWVLLFTRFVIMKKFSPRIVAKGDNV